MNKADRIRLDATRQQAEKLMNMDPMSDNKGITNADVVEALLGDIALITGGSAPHYTADLVHEAAAE